MKILLVQTDPAQIQLGPWLAGLGHEVRRAATWPEAQTLARNEEFAVIVIEAAELGAQPLAFCASRGDHFNSRDSWLLGVLPAGRPPASLSLAGSGIDDVMLKPFPRELLESKLALGQRHFEARLDRRRTERALGARAEQQVAIAALGQCAVTEDLVTLANLVTPFVMHALEVEFCRILQIDPERNELVFLAGFGWRQKDECSLNPPRESFSGRTLAGEDLIVEDLAHDSQFAVPDEHLLQHGIVSGISVAIKSNQGVSGLLGAYTAQKRAFSESDMRFLEGLANVLAAALERKRSEAELQRQQAQLQHLQRLESVGQLAAGLAHDYNNVLTIIHGHLTLALSDPSLSPKLATSVKTALAAVERAASLTRQLLTFSRKQSIHQEPVDLNSVIANLTKLLDRVLGENIRLEFTPHEGLPAVKADMGMLDQVLMNLAVNARDAMPSGGRLRMSTAVVEIDAPYAQGHPGARPGEFVCVQVSDTGCGMDEPTLRRIFEPFFTTKGPGKGTGLGLATVYGIVKQHEGWIEVDSALGKGTTFRVFLPSLGQTLAPAAAPAHAAAAAPGHETILLVEDEPSLRELAQWILEDLGYRVVGAGSGAEALKSWAAQKDTVAVLLTDLVLPDGLTGFDLSEQLKVQKPALKVLFTSGYAVEEVRERFAGQKDFHFIQKPYRPDALAAAIRECLSAPPRP